MTLQSLWRFFAWPILAGLLVAILAFFFFPELRPQAPTPVAAQPLSYAEAVNHAAESVVNVYSRRLVEPSRHPLANHPLYRHLFRHPQQQERMQSALGSGVIVSEEGYLLTNNHVIDGADEVLVLLHDGRRARAAFIGSDPESDLAVLKIELDNLTPIQIGNPAQARVGDVVLAIGNPFGVGQTVTLGIISALSRYGLGLSAYENYIQTDAAINPGNSGGALIDATGKLLGINAAVIDDTVGIGFAVPADDAMKTLESIVRYGRVVRGWLGLDVERITPAIAQSLGLQNVTGVLVTAVLPGNPAHLAGMRPGDVITHINGQAIGNERQGLNQVADISPGTRINIRLLRPQSDSRLPQELELQATVGERPPPAAVNRT